MYDRAARNFTFQSSVGTSFNIGPGSYQHFSTINSKSEAYAPFQSLASRDFNLSHEDAMNIPGPSQYDSKLLRSKIFGGSSISNTDVRFKPLKSDIPGPGQYCIEDEMKCHSAQNKKNSVEKTKITFKRIEMPPSIPHAKTAFGYEEGPYGVLVKQGPPQRDDTLGPAFYDAKISETRTTEKYKGCFWSNDRAKRTDFGGSKGPGPGEYEPFADKWVEMAEYLQSRDNGKLAQLHVPRFIDDIQKKAIKDHVPGPASYMHSGKIDCPKALYMEDGSKIEHPPFMCQAKRFHSSSNNLPGPGAYNDPRTALASLKKVTGMKRSPFGMTSTRFTQFVDLEIPGPQVYNIQDDLTSVTPSYISFTKKGGFGSTSIRDPDLGSKNTQDIPGPSHYQPKSATETSKPYQSMSSMFASLTNRDYDPVVQGKAHQPDGTTYDVVSSFRKSQGKKYYTEPRTKEAKRRHCSFISFASRYAKGSPLDCVDPSLPGPSHYETKSYLNTKTGKFYYRQKRFNEHLEDTPGPGQYELSEKVANTVNKPTFNTTLGGISKDVSNPVTNLNPPTRQTEIAI